MSKKQITVNISDAPIQSNRDIVDLISDVSSSLEDLSDAFATEDEDMEEAIQTIDEAIAELVAIKEHLEKDK